MGFFFYINYSNKKIKPCIFMYFWSEMENSKKQHTHTNTHTTNVLRVGTKNKSQVLPPQNMRPIRKYFCKLAY